MKKIKVLLVDDSALIRHTISSLFKDNEEILIVGVATNPFDAVDKLRELKPDVLLLDVEMPRLDGISFLKNIMSQKPMPVIIFSSYVSEGSANAFKAFEYGAVDIIEKPKLKTTDEITKYKFRLRRALKTASIANISNITGTDSKIVKSSEIIVFDKKKSRFFEEKPKSIIAIGASTGGTEAIKSVLQEIPEYSPPIVVTQHMPVGFTNSFAKRLNQFSKIIVKEAENLEKLRNGHAYIARGDRHLIINKKHDSYVLVLDDSPPVNRHKPSVDVMFNSVAEEFKENAIGVILTGMGADGANGLKNMKENGAFTISQDENTCVVFGMPKIAISLGIVDNILPLDKISESLIKRNRSYTPS